MRQMEIPFLDMTPILEAEEDHKALYLFPFDAHNSPRGLNVIAETIADKVVELGLLAYRQSDSTAPQ